MFGNFLKLKNGQPRLKGRISAGGTMQLIALDDDSPVLAVNAKKNKNYICPECLSPVRVRGGPSRQTHFYHLSLPKICRQHAKSQEHIQTQLKLLHSIGAACGQIECPFPSIHRIADVAWTSKKLVFEIQCSPISLEEAQGRVRDYTSMGYDIVWILHEKQFNQKNLSAAENYLREVPCYFTNINKIGEGIVYDQFEVILEHQRRFKGPPLVISPHQFSRLPSTAPPDIALPKAVLARFTKWKCMVQGDLLHRLLKEERFSQSVTKLLEMEKRTLKSGHSRMPFMKLIANCYQFIIDDLLKKLSR